MADVKPLTQYYTVDQIQAALQCGRSTAYEHLRRATHRPEQLKGQMLRVSREQWERYAQERFGCDSSDTKKAPTGNAASMTTKESSTKRAPGAQTKKRQRRGRLNLSETPVIPIPLASDEPR